jgi:GTPase involved in cell partitioning and DNA repair
VARILARAFFMSVVLQPLSVPADERIEGIVRNTVVTHCDTTRRGGCAGTLTLERRTGARAEMLTIRVPLGTPISRGAERALLHTLEGQKVIVTQTTERGEAIARAIQVAEPRRSSPGAGSSANDVC